VAFFCMSLLTLLLAAACGPQVKIQPVAKPEPRKPALNELVLPALVGIQTGSVWGSGVVVHERGLILTCSHILPSKRATVHFIDGRALAAEVLLDNPSGDFALIKLLDPGPYYALPMAPEPARHGQTVHLYGVDTSKLPRSVTGTVLMRNISLPSTGPSSDVRGEFYFRQAIIHSANAQSGDSGGPLVDDEGRLLGLNVAFGGKLMTVAQSIERFAPVLEQLSRHSRIAQVNAEKDARVRALRVNQTPRTVAEEVELTLAGLVAYAHDVAPERSSEIQRIAATIRRRARSLPRALPGRRLFKWIWYQFMTPLGLKNPLAGQG